ncbi:hypothetical protein M1316_02765, partial [Candidatus Parvarchaeota archaeon]|nr:hypothetical protein [Candidatus Parvarchaeota archaeon]
MAVLIIDVDNTIIDQNYRKLIILKETFYDLKSLTDEEIIKEIKKDYDLKNILYKRILVLSLFKRKKVLYLFKRNSEKVRKFWEIFYSSKYQTEEYLKPILNSQWVIEKMANEGHKIIFLSGRAIQCDSDKDN